MSEERGGPYADLADMFRAGVTAVDPYGLVRARVGLRDGRLVVSAGPALDLERFARVLVVGAGKAAAPMARAVEEILGARLSAGVVVVKEGHTGPLERVRQIEAGHPLPDARGVAGAQAVEAAVREAGEDTLIVVLISGGGSALLPAPYEGSDGRFRVRLEDKQRTTQALLACGATIQEINCVRKHISRLKGGRLAALAYPATMLNLILSDVVGDSLDTIASGLTVPDPTTFADALAVVARHDLGGGLPPSVLELLEAGAGGRVPETPKSGDPAFARVHNVLLGTNRVALQAAKSRARELGYRPRVLSSRITGEAREVARVYAGIALDRGPRAARRGAAPPCCILGGGESTVTLRGPGRGGRNQEMALAFLVELEAAGAEGEGIYFLSAATDGSDGPTEAAGAFASRQLAAEARNIGLDAAASLAANDSYGFFSRLGAHLKTGPTQTNVCDLQLIIVEGDSGEGT